MIVRAVGIAVLAAVLAACTETPTAKPSPRLASEQTLRFPIQFDFATLDPAAIETEAEAEIAHNLFNGLIRYDTGLNVVPDIAISLPEISPDGLTYVFKLRNNVTFSNGDKVTSKDVLYSWNRAVAMQGPYSMNLSAIAGYDTVAANQLSGAALEAQLAKKDPMVTMSGLSALDDFTVVVKLSSASGWFLPALAQPGVVGMVVDENVVKTDFTNWAGKPETLIGTGPFKMAARNVNQSADFVAVANWWGAQAPTLTRVHVDVVSDPKVAIANYERGAYDVFGYGAFGVPVAEALRIQANPTVKAQVFLGPDNKTYWVSFNMVSDASRRAGGPFTLDQGKASHDLRLAFALAVDKSKLVKDLCSNLICAQATGGLIPKGLIGYLGDGADPLSGYDPARAKSLLASADPTGSKAKGLAYTYDPENAFNETTAKFLQGQWQSNLGVSVELRAVPRQSFITNRLRGDYVLSRDGWTAEYNSPQTWFDNLWGVTAGCPDTTCTSGYVTKAYDQLLAKADAEPLPSAITGYNALSHQLIDDVAYIPLYYTTAAFLIKPYVQGAGANNLYDYPWSQIRLTTH
jgi:ABC-type oligopeptide transport system substrate-binding subunit